jgi:hypothetical protein
MRKFSAKMIHHDNAPALDALRVREFMAAIFGSSQNQKLP